MHQTQLLFFIILSLGSLLLHSAESADSADSRAASTVKDDRTHGLLVLNLEDKGQPHIRMLFHLRNGTITAASAITYQARVWGQRGKCSQGAKAMLLDHVQQDGNTVQGKVVVAEPNLWRPEHAYALDLNIADPPSGTFTTTFGEEKKAQTVTGSLSGAFVQGQALEQWRSEHSINPAGEWRHWKGPYFENRAGDSGVSLIEDLKQARIMWMSEYALLGGGGGASHPHPKSSGRADYNGVLVADDKVYLSLAIGNPDAPLLSSLVKNYGDISSKSWTKYAAKEQQEFNPRQKRLVHHACSWVVDDIMVCMDAATGRTHWVTTFPMRGVSGDLSGKGKGGLWSVGTVHAGRWYVLGSTFRAYCLDAATGEAIWETALLPDLANTFEQELTSFLANNGAEKRAATYGQAQFSPLLIDGVLVCPDGRDHIIGLDANTGKKLWTTRGTIPPVRIQQYHWSPVTWRHKDQNYIFTGIACLEPKTGKELWRIKNPPRTIEGDGVIINDTVMLTTSVKVEGQKLMKYHVNGYKLSLDGATKIWNYEHDNMRPRASAIAGDSTRGIFAFKASHADWYVVDAATGTELSRVTYGNKFWGSMTLYKKHLFDGGNRLCLIDEDKQLHPQNNNLINSTRHTCISPTLADGRFFVYEPQGIVCYDLRKPE